MSSCFRQFFSLIPSNPRHSESGSTLVELAISIPIITLLVFGVSELGRALSELSWINHTACQTVALGTTTDSAYGGTSMELLWDKLYSLRNESLDPNISENFTPEYTSNQEVRVTAYPHLTKLFNFFSGQLGIGCLGGYMKKNVNSLSSFGEFANRAPGTLYNCSGGTGPNTAPCNWSPPVPPSGNGGGCSCFSAETSITLANGVQKPISQVKIGDLVLAWDEESRSQTVSPVINIFQRPADQYYLLNGHLKVTSEHPFYVRGEWVPTRLLEIGDQLVSSSGAQVVLESKESFEQPIDVYNLTVDGVHTYYAAGILVHNKTCCNCTSSSSRQGT